MQQCKEQQTGGTEEEYFRLLAIVEHFIRDVALGFGRRRESRQVFRAKVVVDIVKQQRKVFTAETAHLTKLTIQVSRLLTC